MHLLIPFAHSPSEGCAAVLPTLKLPNLQKLLGRLSPLTPDTGDETSLSPPHERVMTRLLGLPAVDGLPASAALRARQNPGLVVADGVWAFITLCHWQVNNQQVVMSQLPLPDLGEDESAALLAAMRPYFEEDGIALHADQPGRWLARGAVFANLATAATDRVIGRNLAHWTPTSAQAAPLRRLQNEMQMLLYTHPVNDARAARGVLPVNSFWLSGTGTLPDDYQTPDTKLQPLVINTLRDAALAENWPVWTQAWQEIDATHIRPMLQAATGGLPVQLTLCGERNAQSWQNLPQPLWRKISGLFGTPRMSDMLCKL